MMRTRHRFTLTALATSALLGAMNDEESQLPRVRAHAKRRCPHCGSSRWNWLGAVPITPEDLSRFLVVKYRCLKCKTTFLVEEAKRCRFVRSANRCVGCGSSNLERTSREGADIEIYRCKQCNAYMAIGDPNQVGPLIVDSAAFPRKVDG